MLLYSHGTTSCFILLMLAFQLHCTRQLSAPDDYLSVQDPVAKTASHLSDTWDLQRAQSSQLIQPSSRPSSSAQFRDRYLYGKKLTRSFTADRRTPSQRDFSVPSIDYDSWKPLDYGNPMRHDPTIYYVPPTLDTVRFRSGSILPPPVLPATVKNSGLLPVEGITTEPKPVSWPIKPQNPSVLIIHTHQRSGHPQPIYGTPDVEFFHLKTSVYPLENFDRRIDRLNPGSDGGLTLINAPRFGPRASSTSSNSIEPSSTKSWAQRLPRPLVHSTSMNEGQQVLPLYASPMHHVVHMAENRASQLSQAEASNLLFDPTGAGSSSQQNMSLPSPAAESPASTDYTVEHASEKGIGDPYSYVNKQNHLKVPFAIFNKGSLQDEPLLRPLPSPISLLQLQKQQQQEKPALHSESSGYFSVPNSSHDDSAKNGFFPVSEPLGSWLESQEVAEMKEDHSFDKLSSSTSLLPSYEKRISTDLVFRGPLEGSPSLRFVVRNTSTMLDRSGALSTVPPRTDLSANDLVSDARRDRLSSSPTGVPVHAISQPVFVIRQGHSKVKTYGRSRTVISDDQS